LLTLVDFETRAIRAFLVLGETPTKGTRMYDTTLTPLRLARLHAGVPQFVVSKRAGLSPARVSLLERGHDSPTENEKTALARALGIAVDRLFLAHAATHDAPLATR
jgi:hypothetical protein